MRVCARSRRKGNWRKLRCASPEGKDAPLYVNRGKNGQTVRFASATKRVVAILNTLHPDNRFYGDRAAGAVSLDWAPIAKVQVQPGGEPATVVRNAGGVAAQQVNEEKALADLDAADRRDSADAQWRL